MHVINVFQNLLILKPIFYMEVYITSGRKDANRKNESVTDLVLPGVLWSMCALPEVLTPFIFRSLMASGESKNWKTPTEDPASTSACPTEEPPRRWNFNKGKSCPVPCHWKSGFIWTLLWLWGKSSYAIIYKPRILCSKLSCSVNLLTKPRRGEMMMY